MNSPLLAARGARPWRDNTTSLRLHWSTHGDQCSRSDTNRKAVFLTMHTHTFMVASPESAPAPHPTIDRVSARLTTLFAIPRAALPLDSRALQRLIALVLAGWDVRAYPRLGATEYDLDDPAWWCVWLHDHRLSLADYLAHADAVPVPAFPAGAPLFGHCGIGGGIGGEAGADVAERGADAGVDIAS